MNDTLPPFVATEYSKKAIERMASEIRQQLERELAFRDGSDIYRVMQWLGGEIAYYDALRSPTDGSIVVRGHRDFTVYLPRETSGLRDRFTLAHELAHYVLHAKQGDTPGWSRRSGDPERLEYEANWFAAELLMPAARFGEVWRSRDGDARRVAREFGVSPAAASTRARALRLVPDDQPRA